MLDQANTGVQASCLAGWHAVPGLEDDWQELLERCPGASVFQTLPWLSCWWRNFGDGLELCLVLAWAGSRLVGAAPLAVEREPTAFGRARRTLRFVGSSNHAADYCDFLVDPDYPAALPAMLGEIVSVGFDHIDLAHLPGHSPHRDTILRHLDDAGYRVADDIQAEAPVRLLGDRAADRKATNKSSLKRNRNYFRRLGELDFRRVTATNEILSLLEPFFEQHRRRWAETEWPSLFLDPRQRRFYRDLVRELAPRRWLAFDVLTLDGEPLAFHLGFEFRDVFIWYKPTFDIAHAPKSPGQVLIKYLLEQAIDNGFREFDFTIGGESFKHRFANEVRHIRRIQAFRSTARFWKHRTRTELKRRLQRE